jgi:predicted DNA-binding protein with PD1-like motif
VKYTQARLKRIFVFKFEDGDDVLQSVYRIAGREKIRSGLIYMIGAIKDCKVVAGPKKTVIPPVPWFVPVKDAHEVVGFGTLFSENGKPKVHLHMGLGRGKKNITGCLRTESKTYLVLEGVIMELETKAVRAFDKKSKLSLLKL